MENFIQTALIAALLVTAALLLIALGWLLTGKQKIKGGTCGRDPTKDRDPSCGTKARCQLCNEEKRETKPK